MRVLEIAQLVDGHPKLVARLSEDGIFEGTDAWKEILHTRKELGIDRLEQRFNNGYVLSRIVESEGKDADTGAI